MPSLGADMLRGRVVRWRVKAGDLVRRGQVIVEVETDKGLIDVECFHDGKVLALTVAEGAEVTVGAVIARLDVSGPPSAPAPAPAPAPAAGSAPVPAPAPAPAPAPSASGRVTASPLARRRAAELGVDLAAAPPGPEGRISAEDVERAAAASAPGEPRDAKAAMRRAIAASMAKSKREIPHYYLWHTVDVTEPIAWLRAHNEQRPVAERVLFAALLARAVARAAAGAPELNGTFDESGPKPSAAVHLGFATAQRGGGLIAPAIIDAHTLDVDGMMRALGDLVLRVKSGGVRGREMTSGTITLTSLGDQGVDALLPVIQWPQLAIVGAGRAAERPWVVNGALAVRTAITLSLAADHRASDGHRGARFLQSVERHLLAPEAP
ncbi:MAG: hypothetical protein A2138_09105 [Deltaproteobacteria bacterium RBG_16_71_12]|nr:MAG: hypothetical protein A2138_09105 [Deltaproteobacteria bacterium RBG_16_71_12]